MDPSNPAVIFDTGIHPRLETGVLPLLVASEGDEPMKSTWLAQKTSNAFAFKRLSFIYGLFSSLNIQFEVYGFRQLLINFMLVEGDRRSEATEVDRLLNPCAYVNETGLKMLSNGLYESANTSIWGMSTLTSKIRNG